MSDDQQSPPQSDDSPLDLLEDVLEEAQGAVAAKEKLAQAKEKEAATQAAEQEQLAEMRKKQAALDQEKIVQHQQEMAAVTQSVETQRQEVADNQAQDKHITASDQDGADFQIQQLKHSEIEVPEAQAQVASKAEKD